MKIQREWAMPSKWTFDVPCIRAFVQRYTGSHGLGWADPFAGRNQFAEFRNDLNPLNDQPACMDATDFLVSLSTPLAGVIFDPPYSLTQVSRSYADMGLEFKGDENPTGGFPKAKDEIARLVVPQGYVLSFGWNTVGMGINRGFIPVELLVVCHGGNRNDTLCFAEQKSGQLKFEE